MERRENIVTSEDGGSAIASTRYPSSARLLSAIHRGEEGAIRELFLLYSPLLRDQARRMSIDPEDAAHFVTTLLDDVVLHLMENALAPRHLARYLVAALRNRARNRHRDSKRRRTMFDGAYIEIDRGDQRVIAESHSQYSLRASGPANEADSIPLRSAIRELAEKSARELTPDEMIMIVGVGRHLPLRDLAEQLGITYGTARVRLHRLRERFRKIAMQYMVTLKADERREMERFFRRAEVRLDGAPQAGMERRVIARDQVRQPERNNGKAR